ncbi:Glyco_tranf_GTA_type domain containing protein [uncultured Caudovirales phage]|uniref:Glyco_tranf_GTA_type domain containing protein n=1 Tax=uncultured Caudovirales phage TaxID=2100421 RepID=A0A6J7WFT0_9CAUD|nr:Glyco_tranf_GTA_type domain containing protein [uncultured Caudovirales phage]
MFINIITPCSRPENLEEIYKSINIPIQNYRWIVVFDKDNLPTDLPPTVEPHLHRHPDSKVGNAQRNYGLDLVDTGWILFLDDDTILHPHFWKNIKDLNDDLIHFGQQDKDGNLRLTGARLMVEHTDVGCYLINKNIVKDHKFPLKVYQSDGIFAMLVQEETTSIKYIPKVLSVYNALKYE